MIVCRLADIMGERRIRNLSGLARDAGVSRTALQALYDDRLQTFDRGVLDRLCRHLGVGVGDIIQYVPDRGGDERTLPLG